MEHLKECSKNLWGVDENYPPCYSLIENEWFVLFFSSSTPMFPSPLPFQCMTRRPAPRLRLPPSLTMAAVGRAGVGLAGPAAGRAHRFPMARHARHFPVRRPAVPWPHCPLAPVRAAVRAAFPCAGQPRPGPVARSRRQGEPRSPLPRAPASHTPVPLLACAGEGSRARRFLVRRPAARRRAMRRRAAPPPQPWTAALAAFSCAGQPRAGEPRPRPSPGQPRPRPGPGPGQPRA